MVAIEYDVQALTQSSQYANLSQARYCHQDTEEEEDGTHINTRKQPGYSLLSTLGISSTMQTAIENFGSSPENTQYQKDSYEWRQVGDTLEDRNEDQTAYSQPEHCLALTFGEIADRCILLGRNLRHHEFALQHGLKDEGWNHHGNHRRDEDFGDNAGSSNQSLVPEHDGGNIADW